MKNKAKMDFKDHEHDILEKSRSTYIPDRALTPEDLAQEYRISIYLAEEKYNPKRGSPRTFAQQIMRNTGIDMYRRATAKNRHRYIDGGTGGGPRPDPHYEEQDAWDGGDGEE